MNDLLNNSTKPKNIEELYYKILEIISDLYEKYIPQSVKKVLQNSVDLKKSHLNWYEPRFLDIRETRFLYVKVNLRR